MSPGRRFALLLTCSVTACVPTDPDSASVVTAPSHTASSGPALLECPTNDSSSTSATVTVLGGTVSLDGHGIQIPGGGLLASTTITVTEPASPYMEISIRANDAEHFEFEQPVLVTISYARCNRQNILGGPLQVWHVDETTHELIEVMGGIDDKLTQTVSFWTDHLSGYAIAE